MVEGLNLMGYDLFTIHLLEIRFQDMGVAGNRHWGRTSMTGGGHTQFYDKVVKYRLAIKLNTEYLILLLTAVPSGSKLSYT